MIAAMKTNKTHTYTHTHTISNKTYTDRPKDMGEVGEQTEKKTH